MITIEVARLRVLKGSLLTRGAGGSSSAGGAEAAGHQLQWVDSGLDLLGFCAQPIERLSNFRLSYTPSTFEVRWAGREGRGY